jgi:transcriptional regulator with XRE-family HTH domain
MSSCVCTVPYMTSSDTSDVLFGWGRRLQAARTAAGLSRPALAVGVGVSAKTIQRWEATGPNAYTTQPNPAQQRRIAELLDIPVTDLFPRSGREAELEGLASEYDALLERVGGGCS